MMGCSRLSGWPGIPMVAQELVIWSESIRGRIRMIAI